MLWFYYFPLFKYFLSLQWNALIYLITFTLLVGEVYKKPVKLYTFTFHPFKLLVFYYNFFFWSSAVVIYEREILPGPYKLIAWKKNYSAPHRINIFFSTCAWFCYSPHIVIVNQNACCDYVCINLWLSLSLTA